MKVRYSAIFVHLKFIEYEMMSLAQNLFISEICVISFSVSLKRAKPFLMVQRS